MAKRVNTASGLLASGMDVIEATRDLARRHRLSERQARRYVEMGRGRRGHRSPGPKLVFTVKLPAGLARRVRRAARATGQSISARSPRRFRSSWTATTALAMAERQVSAEFVFDRGRRAGPRPGHRVLVPERRARTLQRRDSDDHSQMSTVTERLEPVNDHDKEQERSALGA